MAKLQLRAGIEARDGKFDVVIRIPGVATRSEAEGLANLLSTNFFNMIESKGGAVTRIRDSTLPMFPIIRG